MLIGPNGAGKSNFMEALELLRATPTDFSDPIRFGGSVGEWLWKGDSTPKPAKILTELWATDVSPQLKYAISFTQSSNRLEIVDEFLEETSPRKHGERDVFFYYRYQNGFPVMNVRQVVKENETQKWTRRQLKREAINPEQSVFSQRKDPDLYPEVSQTASRFGSILVFREWSFGRGALLRQPQSASLSGGVLLPNLVNLGLILNDLEHRDCWPRFTELMQRFLPRFKRLSTKVQSSSVTIYLHEDGLKTPVPATRLSDGTIRYLALLAILLNAESSPLICIDEPELGLHPDAMSIIAELLVEASTKTQVVVTTQSDVLVSALTDHANSILVAEYLKGGTDIKRLEQDKLSYWLQKYRLGEVWRIGKIGGNI